MSLADLTRGSQILTYAEIVVLTALSVAQLHRGVRARQDRRLKSLASMLIDDKTGQSLSMMYDAGLMHTTFLEKDIDSRLRTVKLLRSLLAVDTIILNELAKARPNDIVTGLPKMQHELLESVAKKLEQLLLELSSKDDEVRDLSELLKPYGTVAGTQPLSEEEEREKGTPKRKQ